MANLRQYHPITLDTGLPIETQIQQLHRSLEQLYQAVNVEAAFNQALRNEYDIYVRDRSGLDKRFDIDADFSLVAKINPLGGHVVVTADSTSADVTITLPDARKYTKNWIITKKIVAANSMIVDCDVSVQTIDGAATQTTTAQWGVLALYSNGSNWIVGN